MSLAKLALIGFSLLIAAFSCLAQSDSSSQPQSPSTQDQQTTLTVTVANRKQQLVDGLSANDFRVYEDEQLQTIIGVSQSSVPVCMGLVVDTSGSMRSSHGAVVAALMELVRSRGALDSVFVVNFNDMPYLDQDLTNNLQDIESALNRAAPRGGTALYDALTAAASHVAKARNCHKKVLLAVTDGEDNSSRHNLRQTLDDLMNAGSPMIYAIALPGRERSGMKGRVALEELTVTTGGTPFFVESMKDLNKAASRFVDELGRQYSIIYRRTGLPVARTRRKIRVEAEALGQKDLVVRASTEANVSSSK